MDALSLARFQFAITTIYHFFFVPLTLGLVILVAIMETLYVLKKDETYKRMTKFWGKLFLINFAMGVVTGIVQEFQFGMNWSEYSRFMGDIFGAPLAIEALLAFFLESTLLGVWIFGWDKTNPKVHLLAIWLVAFGSNISALWILIANSFMQQPVGYALNHGRAEMTNFFEVITNPHVLTQFPHTVLSGLTTGAFFVVGISAYHMLRNNEVDFFKRSFRMAVILAVISSILVAIMGHIQGQHMVQVQPMKMAAAEALWETEKGADLSIIALIDSSNRKNLFELSLPNVLSFMANNDFNSEVKGINELQKTYESKYGAGNYIPPIELAFWTFRIMVGIGGLLILISILALYLDYKNQLVMSRWLLAILPFAIVLPYIANTAGWLLTEMGRLPWIVFGLFRVDQGASPNVSANMLFLSLLVYIILYTILIGATIYLFKKIAIAGPAATDKGVITLDDVKQTA